MRGVGVGEFGEVAEAEGVELRQERVEEAALRLASGRTSSFNQDVLPAVLKSYVAVETEERAGARELFQIRFRESDSSQKARQERRANGLTEAEFRGL